MSIRTFSAFFYGHTVTPLNNKINFSEGGDELLAEISIGAYTPTDYAVAVQDALNSSGAFSYTVTFNRSTRTMTIASVSGNFSLLASTGSQVDVGAWEMLGFAPVDLSGDDSYTGGLASGSSYAPQFKLQDFIHANDWQAASSATVNKSASGRVEVVKFGDESFYQGNITYVTDISQPSGSIKNNASGVASLRTFMQYIINKRPIEFVPDIDTPATYVKVILESAPGFNDGTGYKLKELYDKGLPGYYETGTLVFRVVV